MAGETTLTVVGNLTADPELRFTPNGAAVANFTIASTPRTFDRATGEWREAETLFLRASVWREAAENTAETLKKGMRVIAQGNLRMRQYETKEGEKRTSTELEVLEIGPSLRFASATVNRNQRDSNYGNGNYTAPPAQNGYATRQGYPPQGTQAPQGQPPQGGAPQADPWAQQPSGNQAWGQGAGDENPPF